MVTKKMKIKSIINYVCSVISWTLFSILIVCAVLLAYYFVSMKLYIAKGDKYKPFFSVYTIVSPSMVPTINVYDIIINKAVNNPTDIQKEDIITFTSTGVLSNGLTVTHRVQDITTNKETNEYEYITKGDNNLIADDAPAKYSNLIGKVILRFPGLGRVQAFVGSKLGWLVVVIIPALIIIIQDVLKLIKVTKYKKIADIENERLVSEIENK
ncbi:MAG: signal peptidase I [bacterium]|nr:signal peptidase I [bacterium]